jgi:RHS repeat-associated protein
VVKARHDYLPFGEELNAGIGGRTTAMGYDAADTTRQRFTSYERDNESGLDFAQARYYSNKQGRFTSPDEVFMDQRESDPQSWNLYIYVLNNPLIFIDPTGLGHTNDVGEYIGDYDGECDATVGLCWSEKNQRWEDPNINNDRLVYAEPNDDPIDLLTQQVGNYIRENQREDGMVPEPLQASLSRLFFGTNWVDPSTLTIDDFVLRGEISVVPGRSVLLLGPGKTVLLLGTARMNLLNAVKNPKLRNFIEYLYRKTATVGNGSTADAIRYERSTGILLSPAGHSTKGKEAIKGLEKLINSGTLDPKDKEIAQQIVNDLRDALR